jgi:hypothetical protein
LLSPRYQHQDFTDSAQAHHWKTRELFTYWRGKCRDGRPPSRQEIDPVDMRSYLANLNMGDIGTHPLRVRYRVFGTLHANFNSVDCTGLYLHEIDYSAHDLMDWTACFAYLSETKAAIIGDNALKQVDGQVTRPYEYCILPLFRDGDPAGGFLGLEVFEMLDRRQIPAIVPITVTPGRPR